MIRDFFLGVISSCFLFSFSFVFFYHNLLDQDTSHSCHNTVQIILTQPDTVPEIGEDPGQDAVPTRKNAVLLLWTRLKDSYGNWQEHFGPDATPYLTQCGDNYPGSKFHIHTDRNLLKESDVLIFNLQDLDLERFTDRVDWIRANFPAQRSEQQKWALFWRETPGQLQIPEEKLSWMDNLFNWTISYR